MYSSDADEQSSHWPGAPFQTEIEPLMHQFVLLATTQSDLLSFLSDMEWMPMYAGMMI